MSPSRIQLGGSSPEAQSIPPFVIRAFPYERHTPKVSRLALTWPQCNAIHRSILEQFKNAIVYGKSVKHQPQRVGLNHELADEDIGTFRMTPQNARRGGAFPFHT